MCGFCGVLNLDGAPVQTELVAAMNATLRHRGPDGEGVYVDRAVGLGHRRLSIVDVAGGAQPMRADDVTLVANAEIYNHRELREDLEEAGHVFQSRCDTEVILHGYRAWGVDVVDRLDGMFALAVWDAGARRLVLARDRFGQKPLYYAKTERRLLFASEAKAILAASDGVPAVEPAALARYLLLDYTPSPWSIYRGIRRLPAANVMEVTDGETRMRRYWSLPPAAATADVERTCGSLQRELTRSVEMRMMSDVPVGVFLSGGNDSRIILQEAARARPDDPPACFTIGFDDPDGGFDESPAAQRQAAAIGSPHYTRRFRAADLVAALDEVVERLDEPFADAAVLPTFVLSKFAAERVKVVLAGDGADELFAGYDSFVADRIDSRTRGLDPLKRWLGAAIAARWPPSEQHFGMDFRLRQASRALEQSPDVRGLAWTMTHSPAEISRLYPEAPVGDLFADVRRIDGADAVDRAIRVLADVYLEGDILAKVDRAGMAHGLEVRSPFLDRRLAELVAALPSSFKLRGRRRKWILRKTVGESGWSAKHGFWVPVARWIRGELAGWFDDQLLDPAGYRDGLIERSGVERLLRTHREGRANLRKPLWNLAMLFAWKRRWL